MNANVRWICIFILLGVTLISALCKSSWVMQASPIITIIVLFFVVWLHGTARYGTKNLIIFFLLTWIISNFFEALSIQTGFPFGNYYYDQLIGPRLFKVPLIIMFAYFATGYSAWILANIILGQYHKHLYGKQIFFIPFIAAFIMVLWDLCMDPLCSTVASLWVWKDGGPYFGVPLQNYFGWFFVVYIIYQLFALYLTVYEQFDANKLNIFSRKIYWLEIVALYAIQGVTQIVQFIGATSHLEIYASMALISIFTMIFISLIAYLKIQENSQLR